MITGYADGLMCHWSIELSVKGDFHITLVKPWLSHTNMINDIVIRNNEDQEKIQVFSFSNDCTARIWDLASDSCVRVFKFADPITCGLIDESRDMLIVGGWDKSVKALDLKKNEIDRSFIASRECI